eukprot:CAMPEP_0170513326 /NCGR_PEP_ID=MMETSP0208-20121228/67342_1 /TAXON_ID=197538 /ORGANISM="Strombidium inclinatum, Strain S3" /LENGTH=100 /DNA_ID=CAMNT_0010797051 /DNA_START=74 /DNA_END=376 /DNA_ORIENTATION=+
MARVIEFLFHVRIHPVDARHVLGGATHVLEAGPLLGAGDSVHLDYLEVLGLSKLNRAVLSHVNALDALVEHFFFPFTLLRAHLFPGKLARSPLRIIIAGS